MDLRLVHYYPRALVGDGGCTYAVHGWAASVARAGADVIVAYDQDGERPRDAGVQWTRIPRRRGGLHAAHPLESSLDGADYLVLHSGWVFHNARAARAARRSNVPYLLTPHGAYDPNVVRRKRALKQLWWTVLEREVVNHAAAIHIFFEDERDHLRTLGYRGDVIVAPNGVTIPETQQRSATNDYVLWMGRFDIETKGVDLLLDALASLPADARPPTRLHGPDWRGGKRRAVELVRSLGLERSVTIGPSLYGSDKWDALRDARLFVFPSRWEAQGIVALEAAGMGAPIVATSTTFVGRQLGREGAALLADPDAEGIASAILHAWSSDLRPMGSRAHQLVRDRFSWTTVAESFLSQLKTLP